MVQYAVYNSLPIAISANLSAIFQIVLFLGLALFVGHAIKNLSKKDLAHRATVLIMTGIIGLIGVAIFLFMSGFGLALDAGHQLNFRTFQSESPNINVSTRSAILDEPADVMMEDAMMEEGDVENTDAMEEVPT